MRNPKKILLYLIVISCISCSNIKPDTAVTRIIFAGDIMMHYAVKETAYRHNKLDKDGKSINNFGFDYLFKKLRPVLEDAHLTSGNLEFPVAKPFWQDELLFNCPPPVLGALKKAGFDIIGFANNHTMDQGLNGIGETLKHLEMNDFMILGSGVRGDSDNASKIIEINDLEIGFIAYTGLSNWQLPKESDPYFVNNLENQELAMQDIKDMREDTDFLIMQVHTGKEYTLTPRRRDVKMYKEFLEQGVDLIIAHHPHSLQKMEKYTTSDKRECFIFYSLGNFIGSQERPIPTWRINRYITLRDSILVKLHLSRVNNKIKQDIQIIPIHTKHMIKKFRNTYYKDLQVVSIKHEIALLKEEVKTANKSRRYKIFNEIKYLKKRIEAIYLTVYAENYYNKEFRNYTY